MVQSKSHGEFTVELGTGRQEQGDSKAVGPCYRSD